VSFPCNDHQDQTRLRLLRIARDAQNGVCDKRAVSATIAIAISFRAASLVAANGEKVITRLHFALQNLIASLLACYYYYTVVLSLSLIWFLFS